MSGGLRFKAHFAAIEKRGEGCPIPPSTCEEFQYHSSLFRFPIGNDVVPMHSQWGERIWLPQYNAFCTHFQLHFQTH